MERRNPFVGLRPFDHEDNLYFFGRRAQVGELLQRLHETRFLAVVGSSGCGKSSLIRAGLIPALQGGFLVQDRDRWLIAKMKPAGSPIANLARALLSMDDRTPSEKEMAELQAAIAEDHVDAVLDYLKPRLASDGNLLLLIDQFEEIFAFRGRKEDDPAALGRDERRARAIRQREADDFVELFLRLTRQSEASVYVVLTMRSDFLGDCDLFYGLPEAMNLSRYLVPRLGRSELRDAIEGPPMLLGQQLAPRLVDALLNELSESSDQLPILQHALMRSWDFWQRAGGTGPVDVTHYEQAGTLRESLPRHANEALREVDLPVVERIFKSLTDTDPNHRRVRRSASLAELMVVAGSERAEVEKILKRFNEDGRNFLMISDGIEADAIQVEISHESLIRQWDQLARWVDEERDARDQFRELADRATRGRALLQDPDLQIALNWLEAVRPTPAWARRYSRDPADLKTALDYVERSRTAAVQAKRRRRRNRNLAMAATAAVVVALSLLTGWALDSANRARDTARVAIASDWSNRDPTTAALVFLEVENPERTPYAAQRMRELVEYPFSSNVMRGHEARVGTAVFSPDGSRIATGSDDGAVGVWNTDGSSPPLFLRGHEKWVRAVDWSPDSARIVTGSGDGTVRLWNIDDGSAPVATVEAIVLRGHEDWIETADWSPDGEHVVTASNDGSARIWNADGGGEPVVLRGHDGPLIAALYSPDGTRIVTAADDGSVLVWNADGAGEPTPLLGHQGSVLDLAWSPDGTQIVTGSADATTRVWDVETFEAPVVLGRAASFTTWIESAAFMPDGDRVVTSSNDGKLRVWDAGGGEPVELGRDARGYTRGSAVASSAISPEGDWIATGTGQGEVYLWNPDAEEEEPIVLRGHESWVGTASWSPDGRWLLTGSDDGTARTWLVGDPGEPVVLEGHDDWVTTAVFSPDGSRIATGSDDGTARIWNSAGRDGEGAEPARVLEGHDARVAALAFSPDGRRIVTGSDDGTARLWRVDDSAPAVVLEGHDGALSAVAWSPDGTRVLTGADDHTARVWSVDGSAPPVILRHDDSVEAVAFSPDGTRIASGDVTGALRVWSGDSAEPLVLRGHERKILSLTWSPDGSRIATASADTNARVWNADGSAIGSPREDAIVLPHEGWVGMVGFSPDGERLVSASDDGMVRVFDLDSPDAPRVLRGHNGPVGSASFSADGARVLSASVDGTARVWSADGGGEPLVLSGHSERLTAAAFSPDGSLVVTASTDTTARVWSYGPERLQQVLASMTQACLPPRVREALLDESASRAQRAYLNCEEQHGRVR